MCGSVNLVMQYLRLGPTSHTHPFFLSQVPCPLKVPVTVG
jgi:hypothetical protein